PGHERLMDWARLMRHPMPEADDILFGREGGVATVTLNRPQALNAFTLDMYRRFDPMLRGWADDPAVHAVVIRGAGGRAFCAGGDIRAIYEAGRGLSSDRALTAVFFREEYRLLRQIHRFPKPYLAIIDGITMGGGAGVSVNGAYRVATERTMLAMPETGIGLFPDVGATRVLNLCPGPARRAAGGDRPLFCRRDGRGDPRFTCASGGGWRSGRGMGSANSGNVANQIPDQPEDHPAPADPRPRIRAGRGARPRIPAD